MANTASNPTPSTGKAPVTISEKSYEMLMNLRQVLDEASDAAIAEDELYAGNIITDLLDKVEDALGRVTRYTKRTKVAGKRRVIKAKRKAARGAASGDSK